MSSTVPAGRCPWVYSLNEAGIVSPGTLVSIAGFVLGAYLSNGYRMPNMWTILTGVGGIELGRYFTNKYYTRAAVITKGTASSTYVAKTRDQWLAEKSFESFMAKLTTKPGLIRNTTLGDALGTTAAFGVGFICPKLHMSRRTWLFGTLGACLADILLNAYMTWGNGFYPTEIYNPVSKTFIAFDDSIQWDSTKCTRVRPVG